MRYRFQFSALERSAFAATLVVLTGACGVAPNSTHEGQGAATASLSGLYTKIFGIPAAQREAAALQVGAMSFAEYYRWQQTLASDAPMTVAGVQIQGLATVWKQQANTYEDLNTSYGTLGAYWNAIGYDPAVVPTQDQFGKVVSSMLATWSKNHAPGLALTTPTFDGLESLCQVPDCTDDPLARLNTIPTGSLAFKKSGGWTDPLEGAAYLNLVDGILDGEKQEPIIQNGEQLGTKANWNNGVTALSRETYGQCPQEQLSYYEVVPNMIHPTGCTQIMKSSVDTMVTHYTVKPKD